MINVISSRGDTDSFPEASSKSQGGDQPLSRVPAHTPYTKRAQEKLFKIVGLNKVGKLR